MIRPPSSAFPVRLAVRRTDSFRSLLALNLFADAGNARVLIFDTALRRTKLNCEGVRISAASASDLNEILALLSEVHLPNEGVFESIADFLIARNNESELVGTVGLERHGNTGLLRSVAVAPRCQRSGLGFRLTEAVLVRAKNDGVERVVLLTSTAREFFEQRFGFCETSRDSYDKQLRESSEWNLPRCSSAVCMSLDLKLANANKGAS